MTRLFQDFTGGTTDALLTDAGTTLSGPFLAGLPVIAAPNTMFLTLDPLGFAGLPEIVTVTVHTVSATTATIVRGGANREHLVDTVVVHAVTADDLEAFRDEADPIGSGDVDNTVATRTGINTGNRIHIGDTAPGSPQNGDIWIQVDVPATDSRRIWARVAGTWVQITPNYLA